MEESKRYRLIGGDGRPYLSSQKGTLGGHRRSKVYGRMDCPRALAAIARGGYVQNRVFFADEETALAAGYRPCGTCMRDRYLQWQRGDLEEASYDAAASTGAAEEYLSDDRPDETDVPIESVTAMHKLRWPDLAVTDRSEQRIEVLAYFERSGQHTKLGRHYKNLSTALLGCDGPARLFQARGSSKDFCERHGPCYFFAAAAVDGEEVIATTDGLTFCLLSRRQLPKGSLLAEDLKLAELQALCHHPETPKRPISGF